MRLICFLITFKYSIFICYSQSLASNENRLDYKLDTVQVEGYFIQLIPKKEAKAKFDISTIDNKDFWIFLPKDKLSLIKRFEDLKKQKSQTDSVYLPCSSQDFNDFNYYLFDNKLATPQECTWPLKGDKTDLYKSKTYKKALLFVIECKALWFHSRVSEKDTKEFGSFLKSTFDPNNDLDIYIYYQTIEINSNLENVLKEYSLRK